jgi:hypothetical protein
MASKILAPVLLAGLVWWWTEPPSDELVVYAALCAVPGNPILPPTLAMRTETFQQDFKKYQEDRANCVIVPGHRTTYKLNVPRAEVYYRGAVNIPQRLVDCAIMSRTDWACSYPDGKGSVVVIDGLPAIGADEIKQDLAVFYQRRWQWWLASLWWWVGRPQGAWLIPEQHERL